jgi:hypothetical protein
VVAIGGDVYDTRASGGKGKVLMDETPEERSPLEVLAQAQELGRHLERQRTVALRAQPRVVEDLAGLQDRLTEWAGMIELTFGLVFEEDLEGRVTALPATVLAKHKAIEALRLLAEAFGERDSPPLGGKLNFCGSAGEIIDPSCAHSSAALRRNGADPP